MTNKNPSSCVTFDVEPLLLMLVVYLWMYLIDFVHICGCVTVDRVVASESNGPGFESNRWHLYTHGGLPIVEGDEQPYRPKRQTCMEYCLAVLQYFYQLGLHLILIKSSMVYYIDCK